MTHSIISHLFNDYMITSHNWMTKLFMPKSILTNDLIDSVSLINDLITI